MKPETRAYLEQLAKDVSLPLAVRAVLTHLYAATGRPGMLSAFAKHCAAFKFPGEPIFLLETVAKDGFEKPPSVN